MSQEPTQADVFAALQSGSLRSKPVKDSALYSSFTDRAELINVAEGSKRNAKRVYCFREACGSVILLPNAAQWVESPDAVIPLSTDTKSPFPPPQPLDANSDKPSYGFWHVPDPYSFENVGFSKPDNTGLSLSPKAPGGREGKKVKWLICAECDAGPLGYGLEGGKEAWVSVERVRYGDRK